MFKKISLTFVFVAILTILIFFTLFIINGVLLANKENPISGHTSNKPKSSENDLNKIRIMSYNIAEGFIRKEKLNLMSVDSEKIHLSEIAQIINNEQPDIVFLSEIIFECTPCPINQVKFLAESTNMYSWTFGENYNLGLPFYRIVGGNAILSRFPIKAISNPSLSGIQSFYKIQNNRRALWCSLQLEHQEILLACVHNDSYDQKNNLKQTQQLLEYKDDRSAIIAGDFNSSTGEPSIEFIRRTNEFTGAFAGPPTYPVGNAKLTFDFIFAPITWKLAEQRVIYTNLSDHYPIVADFLLK